MVYQISEVKDWKCQESLNVLNELLDNDFPQIIKKTVQLQQTSKVENQILQQKPQKYSIDEQLQRTIYINQMNSSKYQFNIEVLKSYKQKGRDSHLFDRIEIWNNLIFTASYEHNQQCGIINQDLKLVKILDIKAKVLLKQNNQLLIYQDKSIVIVRQKENNQLEIPKNVYKPKDFVYKIMKLNDDIFICALQNGDIQLFSISNQRYSQTFQIDELKNIREICFIKKQQNEYTFAFGDSRKGMAMGKLIKKGDYYYKLQDQQRLIKEGWISSIMLVNSKTIAYTDGIYNCLKIFDIRRRYTKFKFKLSYQPHIFGVKDFDYELNPFIFVKDDQKITLINLRNYRMIKIIDSRYDHIYSDNKNGSLICERMAKEQGVNIYRLIDIQKDYQSAKIRKIMMNSPQFVL